MTCSVPSGSFPSSVCWKHHPSCLVRLRHKVQGQSQGAKPGSGPGPGANRADKAVSTREKGYGIGKRSWKPAALTGGPLGLTILMESQLGSCCRQEEGRRSGTVWHRTSQPWHPFPARVTRATACYCKTEAKGNPNGFFLGSEGLRVPSPSTSSSFQVIGAEGDC